MPSTSSLRFTLGAGFAAALAASTAACTPAVTPPAPAPVARVAPPPAAPVAPPAPGAVRRLYQDEWFGAVTLVGIDADDRRAVLRLESGAPPRLAIDTVDLRAGTRVERWEATAHHVAIARGAPVFRPLTTSFEEDLVRFAGKLHAGGPWSMRNTPLVPTVVVSDDRSRILFGAPPSDGSDGDWLFVVDAAGKQAKRVDVGMRASYSPVFSPDGTRVAWRGCGGSPCDYGLYVATVPAGDAARDARPRRLGNVQLAKPPVWARDGRTLYGVGPRAAGPGAPAPRGKPAESCLFRVGGEAPARAETMRCLEVRDPSFSQDPDGRTGVLCGTRGTAGTHTVECAWLDLESGEVKARHAIDRGIGGGILSRSGLFAVPLSRGGVAVIDLTTGRQGRVAESEGWFSGFDTTQWLDDDVVLLRKPEEGRGIEVVAVDGRRVSG